MAPTFIDDMKSKPGWSGKTADSLTAMELTHMLEFCEAEGHRLGWEHEERGCASAEYAERVFHPSFPRAWPYAYWTDAYDQGRKAYRAEQRGTTSPQCRGS